MTSAMSDHPLLLAALEEIDAIGRNELSRRELQKRDPRSLELVAAIEALAPGSVADGFFGGKAVFSELGSSRHWRHLRARSLLNARKQQLWDRPNETWFWLRKAAEQRISEKHWKARERSPFHQVLMQAAE